MKPDTYDCPECGAEGIETPRGQTRTVCPECGVVVWANKVFRGPGKYFDNGTATGQASVALARWERLVEEVVVPDYPEVFESLKETALPRYKTLRKRLPKLLSITIYDALMDCFGGGPVAFRHWPRTAQQDAEAVMAAIDNWSSTYNLRCAEKTWRERYDVRGETLDHDWSTDIALTNLSLWNTFESHEPHVSTCLAQSLGFAKGKFHRLTFEVDHYIEEPLALSEEDLVKALKKVATARIKALAPQWLAERNKAAEAAGFAPTKHDETNGLPAVEDLALLAKHRVGRVSLKTIAAEVVVQDGSEFRGIDPEVAEQRIRQRNRKTALQLGLVVRLTNPARTGTA